MCRERSKAVRAALSLALAAVLAVGASAAEPDRASSATPTPGTDVWLSAVPRPTQNRISITVPMVVAFVVNGTADEANADAISVENGSLLLPNVLVTGADDGDDSYQLVTTGASVVVRNYSTKVPSDHLDDENPPRVGLEVELSATVITAQDEDGDTLPPDERADWTLTDAEPTTAKTDYKKYRLSLDGHAFSQKVDENTFKMSGTIRVGAPPAAEKGWTSGGLSKEPYEQQIELGVEVGGTRGMYHQVENSVHAAQIIWDATEYIPDPNPGEGG